ncbi:MAG: hypothetical protein L3J54_14815, partial [Draconibacterium sp.]|nr:hypothetical protein [Draconibacterium sp.]
EKKIIALTSKMAGGKSSAGSYLVKKYKAESIKYPSVLTEILESIFKWYKKLETGSFSEIDSAYFSQLFRVGEWSGYSKNKTVFEAKIIGIGEFGQLQLEKRDGTVEEFMFKEVEFIL